MTTSFNSYLKTSETKTTHCPDWYSPETRIYSSKHSFVSFPTDPFLDVVSFIFSQHAGFTALIDSSYGYSISYLEILTLVRSLAFGLHRHLIVTTMNPLSNMLEIKKQMVDCGVRFAFTQLDKVNKLQKLDVHAIGVPENMDLDSEKPVISQQDTTLHSMSIQVQIIIVIMRRFDVNEVVKVIENYRVTHFPVVPPILTTLTTRVMSVCENGLKSLKHVSSDAAPLNRKTT
ncbi:hypothetical protein GQ457_08G024770 [Hibiscus cannabinus]